MPDSYNAAAGMPRLSDVPKAHPLPWVVFTSTRNFILQVVVTGMLPLAGFAHGEDVIFSATCAELIPSPCPAKARKQYRSAAAIPLSDDNGGRGLEYAYEGNSAVFDVFINVSDVVAKDDDTDFA